MAVGIKAIGSTIKLPIKESTCSQISHTMKENFTMISDKEKECRLTLMDQFTKESIMKE
jgi:hypothetical protein